MKLSKLYSNRPELFQSVQFRDGLNVVLAKILHPKDSAKLSHNLGKTLLIDIIDFGLLRSINKDHLFKRRADIFENFVFLLEIELGIGSYLTIRRSAVEPTKIAFKRHALPDQDYVNLPEAQWDHWRESFDNAVDLLDGILAFTTIKPWKFRKGLGYFLRGQSDYGDVFKLSKFGAGKHKDWKPYLAKVLGFNDSVLTAKYEAEAALEKHNQQRAELQSEITLKPNELDKLKSAINVKRDEVDTKLLALDAFDFQGQEISLTKELAESIEVQIAENNVAIYNARHDLIQIEKSIAEDVQFDLNDVMRVFKEVEITFPSQLAHDYKDLVKFNNSILTERKEALRERSITLRSDIDSVERNNYELNKKRTEILSVIGGTDSFQKFKGLQRQLDQDRATLAILETKSSKLEQLITIQEQARETKRDIEKLTTAIEQMLLQSNLRYKAIQLTFSRIIKTVLHRTALLYLDQNGEGNLDFHADFSEGDTEHHTEEDRGTSFRQMLCIAFDLAVLINYSKEPFFHFVYHDGGLERLQSKVKLALLEVIRETCRTHHIQYIFSTLSEDLPLQEDVAGLCPKPEEIILTLDDSGDSGRLFKMGTF